MKEKEIDAWMAVRESFTIIGGVFKDQMDVIKIIVKEIDNVNARLIFLAGEMDKTNANVNLSNTFHKETKEHLFDGVDDRDDLQHQLNIMKKALEGFVFWKEGNE